MLGQEVRFVLCVGDGNRQHGFGRRAEKKRVYELKKEGRNKAPAFPKLPLREGRV
jgi:hypothetical protein